MNKHTSAWLQDELPRLVGLGVVPGEVAENIRRHYGNIDAKPGKPWALVLFGILGAALIGCGVILLLAHNWQNFGRPIRTVLSIGPLLIAQLIAAYTLLRHSTSMAWREGAATYWALSIGASIALVAQTYHISGDLSSFLLTWALVGLPIIYLLNSSCAAMLYWVAIAAWASNLPWWQFHGNSVLFFWPLMALAVPHLLRAVFENRYQPRVHWLLWVISICGIFGVGWGLPDRFHGLEPLAFASYFATLYLLGSLWQDEGNMLWQRPLQTVGGVGLIVIALTMTFGSMWYFRWPESGLNLQQSLRLMQIAAWLVLAILLWVIAWKRGEPVAIVFGTLPLLCLVGFGLSAVDAEIVSLVVMNLYLLGMGVGLISLGVRSNRISIVNLGMIVISTLIVARFFDEYMSCVVRGIAFILLGIGFLVANYLFVRKLRGTP